MAIEASRVATGTVHITIMSVIGYLASFLFYTGIARILTPEEVGLVSLMLSAMAIFNTFTLLAINYAVIKFVSEFQAKGDEASSAAITRQALRLLTALSLLAFASIAVLSPSISAIAFQNKIEVFTFLLFLSVSLILNYTSYYGAVMAGLAMFGAVAVQNIIYSIGSRVSSIAFSLFGFGVSGVAVGFLLGALTCLTYSLYALRGTKAHSVTGKDNFPLRNMLSFSLPLYAFNVITLAQGWIDTLLLYSLTSALAVTGTYYIVVASSGILSILWSPIVFTLLPALSGRYGTGGAASINYALTRAIKLIVPPLLLVSVALAAISGTVVTVLYGQRYAEGILPFAILMLLSIFYALSNLFMTSFQAIGKTTYIAIAGSLSVLANVAIVFLLVEPFGILGAALGRASMMIVMFMTTYLAVRNLLKVTWHKATIAKSALAALTVGSPLFVLDTWLKKSALPLWQVAVLDLILFLVIGLVSFKLFKPFDKDDLELLESVLPSVLKGLTRFLS